MKREKVLLIMVVVLLGAATAGLHLRGVGGFNYAAYNYFSGLYFKGVNPYQAPSLPEKDISESFRRPSYLDYTGLQLATYNACFLVRHRMWWRLDGFILYSIALWLLAALSAYALCRRSLIAATQYAWYVAMLFAPYLWYVLFFRGYEDKALYLLLPAAILLLHSWSPYVTAGALGALTGLAGAPVLVLPVLLLSAIPGGRRWRETIPVLTKMIALFGVGLALAMLPFFPEALVGWARRSALESSQPYWFSGWRILGSLYFPGLNKVAIVAASGLVYLLYGLRRMTFNAAVVILLTLPFFFSVTMGSQRIMPAVVTMVLAFSTRRWLWVYAAPTYLCLLLFLWLDVTRHTFFLYPVHHAVAKSILLLLPCAWGYVCCLFDRSAGESRIASEP